MECFFEKVAFFLIGCELESRDVSKDETGIRVKEGFPVSLNVPLVVPVVKECRKITDEVEKFGLRFVIDLYGCNGAEGRYSSCLCGSS